MKIAVIGAGHVGGNLGTRFARSGLEVRFGVREAKPELLARATGATASAPAEAAAWGDVVILAVPGPVAVEVARSLSHELAGKIVVDCNNPLVWRDGPVWNPPPEGSLASAIAAAAPGARVLKGFNTFGAEFHEDPRGCDVFFAGDDVAAKSALSELATRAGFHPVDAGPLRNASVLENLAMLWIHLATVGGRGRAWTFKMQAAT